MLFFSRLKRIFPTIINLEMIPFRRQPDRITRKIFAKLAIISHIHNPTHIIYISKVYVLPPLYAV